MTKTKKPVEKNPDKPPIFSSWKKLYIAVFLNLVLVIILFTLFMKLFQ